MPVSPVLARPCVDDPEARTPPLPTRCGCGRASTHAVLVPWADVPADRRGWSWETSCASCLPTGEAWPALTPDAYAQASLAELAAIEAACDRAHATGERARRSA